MTKDPGTCKGCRFACRSTEPQSPKEVRQPYICTLPDATESYDGDRTITSPFDKDKEYQKGCDNYTPTDAVLWEGEDSPEMWIEKTFSTNNRDACITIIAQKFRSIITEPEQVYTAIDLKDTYK